MPKGMWTPVPVNKEDLFTGPIKISDAYGMTHGNAKKALMWAQRHGWPGARIVKRDNGYYGVALN